MLLTLYRTYIAFQINNFQTKRVQTLACVVRIISKVWTPTEIRNLKELYYFLKANPFNHLTTTSDSSFSLPVIL